MLQYEPNRHKLAWGNGIITIIVVCFVLLGFAWPFILYNFGKSLGDWNWEFPLSFIGIVVYFLCFGVIRGSIETFSHKGR